MRKNILFALVALFSFAATIQAQTMTIERPLKSKLSTPLYFQVANSGGDSSNTLGDLYYAYGAGGFGSIYQTFISTSGVKYLAIPDSMKLRYYSTNDSVVNVTFGMRIKYAQADSAIYSSIGIDTATVAGSNIATSGNLARRGLYTITKATYTTAIPGGVAFSVLASGSGNVTGTAAAGVKNGAKIYLSIVMYYTKP